MGILQQASCVYTHQQNGVAERKHQQLLNVARYLKIQAHLPSSFSGYCVLTAAHLINLIPSKQLNFKSPYVLLFNKTPNYAHLKIFGCFCYMTKVTGPKDKLDSKAAACVFLGYPFGTKGNRVLDLLTRKTHISRDVYFVEHKFPFSNISPLTSTTISLSPHLTHENASSSPTAPIITANVHVINSHVPDSTSHFPVARPTRHRVFSSKFVDYTGLPNLLSSACTNHVVYPLHHYMSYHIFKPKYVSFLTKSATVDTPYTYSQAVKSDVWCQAMREEILTLESNNTWQLVHMPVNTNIVDYKWLYKIKYKVNSEVERYKSEVERYKARLVAKGLLKPRALIILKRLHQ